MSKLHQLSVIINTTAKTRLRRLKETIKEYNNYTDQIFFKELANYKKIPYKKYSLKLKKNANRQ
jgi:hypothetical protein